MNDLNKLREGLVDSLEAICSKADIRSLNEWKDPIGALTEPFLIKNLSEIYNSIVYDLENEKVSSADVEKSLECISKRLDYADGLFRKVHSDQDAGEFNSGMDIERAMGRASRGASLKLSLDLSSL